MGKTRDNKDEPHQELFGQCLKEIELLAHHLFTAS
jgi:hypothetical protein